MEKISEGLRLARAEKEAFRQTLMQVVVEAAAQGDCFDGIRRALEVTVETERSASFERFRELEEKEKKIRRSIEERARELQSSGLDGTSRALEARKEELRRVDELLAVRRTELAVKNEELDSLGGLIAAKYAEIAEELPMKEAELEAVRESISECTQAVDSKRKELEQILAKIEEFRRVSEEMEVRSNSPKSRWSRLQQQQYHRLTLHRERLPEEQGFPHCPDPVNPGEKIKTEPLKIVSFVGSTFSTDSQQNLLSPADDNTNMVNQFFTEAYVCGLDPAKVVLDMIQGSPHLLQNSWDAADISLLEQLMELSPPMAQEVVERAFQLATEWKIKLEDKPESQWSALGFFHFLAAYKLISSFDKSQIRLLAEAFSLTKSHPELCQALGLTAENDGTSPGCGQPGRGTKRPCFT